ncbi:MAG: alcohol dehydrogenase [Acidobacteria bacterium]|nr:alcohol dehydrogenase [Acidobacteriota bacterium]
MLAVHVESGRVSVRRRPRPRRREGLALVRLLCGGVCNTDLELLRGYYGFRGTPGHEFVGEVVETDDRALVGRRVVGEINLACKDCDWCRRGLGRHCPHRTVLGIVEHPGCFSEFFTLPECNLHVVPDNVPTEAAVFTEPLAAACEVLEQVAIPPGGEVAIRGPGKLGQLVARVLGAHGCRVSMFARHDHAPRAAFRWVVDATGSAEGLRQCIEMTQPRGTVVVKSTVHGAVRLETAPVVVNEIALTGSRCGRFEPALELLRTGRVQVEDLISARFALSDAPLAFRAAARRGALKVLLAPGLRQRVQGAGQSSKWPTLLPPTMSV